MNKTVQEIQNWMVERGLTLSATTDGAAAYRVIDPAKLDSTIAKAVKSGATTFVEVIVEPRANVYPMIPGGRSVNDTIFD